MQLLLGYINMGEMISKLDGGEFLGLCGIGAGLCAIIGVMAVAITAVLAVNYRKRQRDEMEATLKMEMIQRGMSAAEIKQVLEAKMGAPRGAALAELMAGLPQVRMHNIFSKEAKKA